MLYSSGSVDKIVDVVLPGLRMRCLFVIMYVLPVGMIDCLLFLCLYRCVLMLW